MTVLFSSDGPDDRPQHSFDENCEICSPGSENPFADEDFDDFDDTDLGAFDAPDGWEPSDDLYVDFMFDPQHRRLICVHTGGLWLAGIPELYIRPPQNFGSGNSLHDARTAAFLATGLVHLGQRLLGADGFTVPPYWGDFDGQQVQFWLAGHEPPFKRLAANLDPDVDTVIRVDCSLWHPALLGDG